MRRRLVRSKVEVGSLHREPRDAQPWLLEVSRIVRIALVGMSLGRQSSSTERPVEHSLPLIESDNAGIPEQPSRPLIIASMLREEGITGVHTHIRQLRQYLGTLNVNPPVVTPFSWNRTLTVPVFGVRLALSRCSGAAGVVWYRHWHEEFLHQALRRRLAELDDCVIYAQDPPAARAALRARRGPQQLVILAVHFRISQSDEWVYKKQITQGGTVFRWIRKVERDIVPQVDGIVFVSTCARRAL